MRLTGPHLDLGRARELVEAATKRATRTPHRFDIALTIEADALPARIHGRLVGVRDAGGASRGRLTWSGLAGAALPELDLRIVHDRLALRERPRGAWRELGSASGVSLDVGRELLDHPFLLTYARARGRSREATVVLVAPPEQLRRYATDERRGPVSELLAGATSLTLVAHIAAGELAGDAFTLVTDAPSGVPLVGSGRITIRGRSGMCPTGRR